MLVAIFNIASSFASAQIFLSGQISGGNNGYVGLYANNGDVISHTFITIAGIPNNLLLVGNKLYLADTNNGRIAVYNATSGAVINANFITGLRDPAGMVTDGTYLYVPNAGGTTVAKYDLASGEVVNLGFVTGLQGPVDLVLSDGFLYVTNYTGHKVGKYSGIDGSVVNSNLISVFNPRGIAIMGNELFVGRFGASLIGKYDATTGAPIDDSFISTGSAQPQNIVISGTTLFVALSTTGNAGKFDALTGASIDSNFIRGPGISAVGLAITPAPASTVANVEIVPAVAVQWMSQVGKTYQVQESTDLAAWSNYGGPVSGDGGKKTAFDIPGQSSKRFYRVQSY